MRIYLAGPMRGIPKLNHPAFDAATLKLRVMGHDVFSPAEYDRDRHSIRPADVDPDMIDEKIEEVGYRTIFREDLTWITTYAELVALLPGWENSLGARAEIATAHAVGIPVALLEDVAQDGPVATLDHRDVVHLIPRRVDEVEVTVFGGHPDLPVLPATADAYLREIGATPQRQLVGLSGYATAGKDEAARALTSVGWERRAFADKLRDMLYALNPIIVTTNGVRAQEVVDILGWQVAKRESPEIRTLLQRLGTEAGRHVLGENVWVDACLRDLGTHTVVTDCRFPNEADAIKAAGGILVRITRPGVGPANSHPSETALDTYPWDLEIVNDGTIDDLHRQIRGIRAVNLEPA